MPKHPQILIMHLFIALSRKSGTWLKQILIILMLTTALVGMSPTQVVAAGTTYYVDNTNPVCSDSGAGSQELPFCTIQNGSDHAITPGDTVDVLHGRYAETVFAQHSGAIGNPIIFHAEPDVTVTGSTTGFGSGFALSMVSYVVIDGFNITQTKSIGIYIDTADHIQVSHNQVSYAGKDAGAYSHSQGIYLRNTSFSTVTHNVTDHNSCIGIWLINNSSHNLISRNISFGNSSTIAYPVVVVSDAAGIELTGSSDNTVINNIAYSNEDSGINVYVYEKEGIFLPSTYNLIIGNLSYGNGDHGIDMNNSPYNTVTGNTIQGNGTVGINLEGNRLDSGSHHTTIMNNISVGNGFTPPANSFGGNLRVEANSMAGTVLDYNLFDRQDAAVTIIWGTARYPSLAEFRAAVPDQEQHGLEGNALFVNPVPSVLRNDGDNYFIPVVIGDYHLFPGSLAIDSANADAPGEQPIDIEYAVRCNDPNSPDTGAGVRTFDDRGAFEFRPFWSYLPIAMKSP